MKLTQGHVWKCGNTYVRIVHIERLTVDYKAMASLDSKTGTHHQVSKKEFCRMLKGASLIAAELPIRDKPADSSPESGTAPSV